MRMNLVRGSCQRDEEKAYEGSRVYVRGNPGRSLGHCVAYITGEFLADGVVMHTRDKRYLVSPISIQNGNQLDVPVVILIDCSAVPSGSSKCWQARGRIISWRRCAIGAPSYGKGSVQSIFSVVERWRP